MDRLTSMLAFVRVAESKSFAAAAEQLDVSPTMVAKHIRAQEEALGARLIERTTRRHALTDVGMAYLERCRDVLAAVDAANGVAEAAQTQPEGLLRVTASVSYGAHRLMPVVAEYCRAYPRVEVEVDLNDRVVDLQDEGFHVALRSGVAPGGRFHAQALKPSEMWAAASPAYLQRCGVPLEPGDLAHHACLAFAIWGRNHHWRFSRTGEVQSIPIRGPLTVNSGQGMLQAALAGLGVVVQADVLLQAPVAEGRLVRVLADWRLPTRAVHLVTLRRTPPSAKLRSFVDLVVARLGS